MKKYIITLFTALSTVCASVTGACAATLKPIAANESKLTMWILIAVVAVAAIGGVVYFIIQHNNKKK